MPADLADAADRADGMTAATPPAPAFTMVGTDDAGLCVDGVCALPPTGAVDGE